MRRIIYISTSVGLPEEETRRILDSSERNNAQRDITGFLLYNGRNFMQMIEGPEASLFSLMSALRRDPRHSGLTVLMDDEVDARVCPQWTMHRVRLADDLRERRDALDTALCETLAPGERTLVRNFALLN